MAEQLSHKQQGAGSKPAAPTKSILRPAHPCHNCGANEWWLRETPPDKPEYICGICHPPPSSPK